MIVRLYLLHEGWGLRSVQGNGYIAGITYAPRVPMYPLLPIYLHILPFYINNAYYIMITRVMVMITIITPEVSINPTLSMYTPWYRI